MQVPLTLAVRTQNVKQKPAIQTISTTNMLAFCTFKIHVTSFVKPAE